MKIHRLLAATGAALVVAAAACDDNPFITGNFGVDGRWTGSARAGTGADTARFFFDLTLSQDRNEITGTGEIRGGAATFPVDVTGRWESPGGGQVSVDLVMRAPDLAPLTFDGEFDQDTVPRPGAPGLTDLVFRGDTINGTLRGSALDNVRLELGRS